MKLIAYILFLLAGGFTFGFAAKMSYLLVLNPVIEVPRMPNLIDGIVTGLVGLTIVVYSFVKLLHLLRRAEFAEIFHLWRKPE